MSRQRALILALVAAFLLAAGCAFADETTEGTDPRNIEVQLELAQKMLERAGLAGTVAEDPGTGEEQPGEEPAEETPEEEATEEEVEETMPREIAAQVAERHAFIAWSRMNGLPASRNLQNQETWQEVWAEVLAATATGTSVQDALAAANANVDPADLEALTSTPPGQLEKTKAKNENANGTAAKGVDKSSSGKSAENGDKGGSGKGEGKGKGKGEGKGKGKGGNGGGKNK